MLKKLKFTANLLIYKVQCILGLKRSDIISSINEYYRPDFKKLEKKDIAIILPHCLIDDKCPAGFSKNDGIICKKCGLCGCGDIMKSAEERGYQFYITASVGFTKRLVERKNIRGVVGVACDYEIEKGISSERITNKGVKINHVSIKTQAVCLDAYDCISNSVDWKRIEELMK